MKNLHILIFYDILFLVIDLEKEIINKVKFLIKKGIPLEEMAERVGLSKEELIGLAMILKEEGFLVDYIDGELVKLKKPIEKNDIMIPKKNNVVKFLALSDIHYGSKWDNTSLVNYAYEVAEKEKVDFITNSGDIVEGDFKSKRPEHIYQVRCLGLEQLDYVVDKYPKSTIPTYFITGNHDATFIKTCGADIGKMLVKERPDLTYLGQDLGDIKIENTTIRLRHGSGGNAYAKGYKLQKYCESLPIDDLPTIILQGHFHYSAYFKNRDIHCFNVPSLQGYTPYAKSLGLPQEMGFWLITCVFDNKGHIVSITPELYQFEEKYKIRKLRK